MEPIGPEVRETVTTYFLLAWLADVQGNTLACGHYLARAFRTLAYAGVEL